MNKLTLKVARYTNTYFNTNGCDSTHTLNLTINNEVVFFEDVSACEIFMNGMEKLILKVVLTNIQS